MMHFLEILFLGASLIILISGGVHCDASVQVQDYIYPPVNESESCRHLYFSLIQSFSGQYVSAYSITGLELALDQINAHPNLLPGYCLHYVFTDAPCDTKPALNAFHHQVFTPPIKIGILGAGCSVSTEPVALISHYYNINQVSCIASSPAFKDQNLFPNYFQLLPTDANLAKAYYGVIREFGWRRVALLVQPANLFTVAMDDLKPLLKQGDVEYTEKILNINDDNISGLSTDVFDENSRIYIISSYETIALQIICEAYKKGYAYPRYVFLTIAWYSKYWWTLSPEKYGCTSNQVEHVLEYSLSLLHLPYAQFLDQEQKTDFMDMTVGNYFERVRSDYINKPPLNLTMDDDLAPVCHDAMWTFAKALNNTITEFANNATLNELALELVEEERKNQTLSSHGQMFHFDMFSYKNYIVLDTIFKHLKKTDFIGVSGNVSFDENGIRQVTQLIILQFRSNKSGSLESMTVGRVSQEYKFSYYSSENEESTWPKNIPYDGKPTDEVLSVHISLTVMVTLLSSAGIIFSIACLIFNFYFRNTTLIRLTSPNLNYMIGSGAIILYSAIILAVIPVTSAASASVLCNLTVWLTAFGYSLCYGTIFVKMLRVYYIFNNPTTQKKMKLHDWFLALMVMCLLVIDVLILVVYSAVEGAQGNIGAIQILDKEFRESIDGEQGRVTIYYVYICDSHARDIFLGILYGYKALLQIVGLFLAFATRKVKIKGIDDAKEIAATIYITSLVLAIVIVSMYTINELINTYSAVFSTGFFIGTTFIMAFVFTSKMFALYKDPEGRKVFDRTMPTSVADGVKSSSVEKTN